jgi:hypothetical protein
MEAVLERLIALQSEMNSLILEVTKQVRGVEPVEKRKVGRPKKIVLAKDPNEQKEKKEPYKMTDEHKAKLKAGREAKKAGPVPETLIEPTVDESTTLTAPVSDDSTVPHEEVETLACHREPPQSPSCAYLSDEIEVHESSPPSPTLSANKPKIKLAKKEPQRICRMCNTDLLRDRDHRPCLGKAFDQGLFKSVSEWEDDCIEFAKVKNVT